MAVVKHRIEGNVIRRMVADEVITSAGVAAQCTAQSDVDFLKTAANAKHRLLRINHAVHHRYCYFVAAIVEWAIATIFAIKARSDIRRATREQNAVNARGDICGGHQVGKRRDD